MIQENKAKGQNQKVNSRNVMCEMMEKKRKKSNKKRKAKPKNKYKIIK